MNRKLIALSSALVFALAITGVTTSAQTASSERWLHVRVENSDNRGETVRVNVPLSLAEKILPAIHNGELHDGKIRFDHGHMDDVDLRALLEAVRDSKDGEFVTIQKNDGEVRVAKQGGFLLVHVRDTKHEGEGRVEVRVPMSVVNALVSSGGHELDLAAGIRALSSSGDAELVSVKDRHNTVRVWVDTKNTSD
jgi:hypothetical protein